MDLLTLAAVNLLVGLAILFCTAKLALSQPAHLYWRWFAGCGAALVINSLCGLSMHLFIQSPVILPLIANVATISLHCCLLFGVGQLLGQPQNYQWLWLPGSIALLHTWPELQQNLQLRLLVCFAAIFLLNAFTLKILLPACRQPGQFALKLLSATLWFNLLQLGIRWLLYLLESLQLLTLMPAAFMHQLGFFCLTIMAALTLASFLSLLVEQQQAHLQTQAHTDALTGLLNRHQLEHKILALMNQCNRQQQSVALLVLDIDYFKQVNDSFGHSCGDLVLQAVADTIKANCRDYDLQFRLGGEEFLICLANADEQQTQHKAEQLRQAIRQLHLQQARWPAGLQITASIGWTITAGQQHVQSLLEQADAALYRAKQQGRDLVVSHGMLASC